MKLLLLCALISTINAKPEGYFRQEYQFKKSSSTFQNNELQTKNEDEGFYAKHGDLEGNTAPKVNQHTEHREFVNPKLDGVGHTVTTYGDRDLTQEAENVFANHGMITNPSGGHSMMTNPSGGHSMMTNQNSNYGAGQGMITNPSNNYGGGARSHSYSSFSSYSSSGQSAQPKTYVTHSNLGQLTQNLEYDLQQQLHDAMSKYNMHSINTEELRILENELKANLTRQLNEALYNKYGRQGQSGSFSYSISTSGGYNPKANYDNQELTDLSKQLEQNLIKQLHENVRTTTHYQSGTSYVQTNRNTPHHRDSAEVEDLNRHGNYQPKPNYNHDDDLQQNTERITYASALNSNTKTYMVPETPRTTGMRTDSYSNSYRSQSNNQYKPLSYSDDFPQITHTTERIVIQPSISITDVAQQVQNDLSHQLNEVLRSYEEKYTNSDYLLTHTRPNYQDALEDFKREVRYNLTRHLNEELQRNYGNQVQRGEYSFSIGSRTVANYRVDDLNNLKKQVEDNLIKHLENTFRQQENRYVTRTQTQTKTYHSQSPVYTRTLTDDSANTHRYSGGYSQHAPVRTRPLTDENAPNPGYGTRTHSQTMYTTRTTNQQNNPELQQITNQVQDDLTQKMQAAVQKQRSSYTNSHNDQNNQALIDELTEELRQNLTKSLDESLRQRYGNQGTRGGYSYSVSTSGTYSPKANYNRADLNALMTQMQADLERQLREQMSQQSYQSQSHYSSYGPVRYTTYRTNNYYPAQTQSGSFQKYEQFNSGYQTKNTENLDDCMQGDAPADFSQELDADDSIEQGQQIQSPYYNKPVKDEKLNKIQSSYSMPHQDLSQLPQQEDDYEDFYQPQPSGGFKQFGQQVEENFDKSHVGQQVDQLGQQVEDDFGQFQIGQEVEDDLHVGQEMGQQPEDDFEKLQVGQQIEDDFGQGQQVEDDFGQFQVGQQVEDGFDKLQVGQQVEDDLGQQQIDDDFGQFQVGQQVEDDHGKLHVGEPLGQQTEDDFEKLQVGQQIQDDFQAGQQVEEDYQNFGQQQIEQADEDFGKLHVGQSMVQFGQHQDEELGQQIEDLDKLTQQTEDAGFGKLEFGNHQGQHVEEGQQIENLNQLTQQVEDDDYGKLQVGNQNNQLSQQNFNNLHFVYKPQTTQKKTYDDFEVGQEIEDSQLLTQQNEQQEDLTQQIENIDFPKHTEGFGKLQLENSHSNKYTEESTTAKSNLEFINSEELTQQLPQDFFGNLQNGTNNTVINKDITHMQNNANRQPSRAISLGDAHRTYINRPIDAHSPREIDVSNKRNEMDLTQREDDLQLTQQQEQLFPQQTRPYSNGYHQHSYNQHNTQQQEIYSPSRTIYFSRPMYIQTPYTHSFPQTQNSYRVQPPRNTYHSFGDPEDTQQIEEPTQRNMYHSSYSSGYNQHRFEHTDDTQQIEEIAPPKIYHTYSSGHNYRNSDDSQRIERVTPPSNYHSSGYNYNRDDTQQIEEMEPKNWQTNNRNNKFESSNEEISQNEDLQQEIEPVAVPNSHPQGRRIETETDAAVEEVTEGTTPQTGFWKRVGGKISNTYKSAKQKAKDLFEKN